MPKTIAILFHENEKHFCFKNYNISIMAKIWRDDGYSIKLVYGIKRFVPADICFVHVDLSVVPDAYIQFANCYPVVINGRIKNILKSKISKNLVKEKDNYQGSVIVKTDRNYAGWPESLSTENLTQVILKQLMRRTGMGRQNLMSQSDYRVFPNTDKVPERYFREKRYVVEKFLPERHEDLYCVNYHKFFGGYHHNIKLFSKNPIVSGANSVRREYIAPHPEILKVQDQLEMDYGKLDYCIVDNRVVLLDANKTVGVTRSKVTKQHYDLIRQQAVQLYSYL